MSKMKQWQYVINQFLNSTKKSFRKALILSNAHDAYLLKKMTDTPGDPDWSYLYGRYHPIHIAYRLAYNNWVSSGGSLSGDTQSINDLLKAIHVKLDQWIGLIIPVYAKASAQFKKLFPQGRKPFEHGKIDVKISAIETLSTSIGTDAALAPVKTLVDAAYAEIDTARTTQGGGKSAKKTNSGAVEAARVDAMNMQYADVGFLINKYYATPKNITPLFDLQTLRNNIQSLFTRKMKPTETSELCVNTFKATDAIRAKVADAGNATDKVTIYLASTPGGVDSIGIVIHNNAELKFEASQFVVDLSTHTFLTAVTTANLEPVDLTVEIY